MKSVDPGNLAVNLRKHRHGSGQSKIELAQEIDVPESAVMRWETTDQYPPLDYILRFSRLFHVSIDHLLFYPDLPSHLACGHITCLLYYRMADLLAKIGIDDAMRGRRLYYLLTELITGCDETERRDTLQTLELILENMCRIRRARSN